LEGPEYSEFTGVRGLVFTCCFESLYMAATMPVAVTVNLRWYPGIGVGKSRRDCLGWLGKSMRAPAIVSQIWLAMRSELSSIRQNPLIFSPRSD